MNKHDASRAGPTLVDKLERFVEMVDYRSGRHVTDSDPLVDVLAWEHVRDLSSHVEYVRHSVMS